MEIHDIYQDLYNPGTIEHTLMTNGRVNGGSFAATFRSSTGDVDAFGHVNNVRWLAWGQTMATAHWLSASPPAERFLYAAMVLRHEIDFRGNVGIDRTIEAKTWISKPAGARYVRHIDFSSDGDVLVQIVSDWVQLTVETLRPKRISKESMAIFSPTAD